MNTAAFHTEESTKYFAPQLIKLFQEQVANKWIPRTFGNERTIEEGIVAYKLEIHCGTLKKEKFINIAGLALHTAWLYRLQGKEKEGFLEIARNRYEDSYSNNDFSETQMSETRVIYLIAELSRRIGEMDFATHYFSKVLEKQSTSLEPKLIEMAKERWQEMRRQKEKEAN